MEKCCNIEVLSPAGDIECLKAAINSGAAAVYLGLNKFNARMKANNFDANNLREWITYAHLFGVKVYVAINTLIKEREFNEALILAKIVEESHADALILTDLGLVTAVLENLTIPVFISTQVNTHNLYGVKFLEELGVNGVVLSRETSLSDIDSICKCSKIAIECFVHGAVCVSVSGQCYLSAYIDGNSGNRGLCAQACRRFYRCYNEQNKLINKGYLLSAKDLCGLRTMDKLAEMGVKHFKIEGRGRRKDYVSVTSEIYNKRAAELNGNVFKKSSDYNNIVSSYNQNDLNDLDRLKEVFNRGDFTEGYAFKGNSDLIYPWIQGHKGRYIGKVSRVFESKITVNGYNPVEGDAFKIFRNNTEVGNGVTRKGEILFKGDVKYNDEANITSSVSARKQEKLLLVCMEFFGKVGNKARLYAGVHINDIDLSVSVESKDDLEAADQKAVSREEIERQLRKTGGSGFEIKDIEVHAENIFIPISALNELRRIALSRLVTAIINRYNSSSLVRRKKFSKNQTDILNSDILFRTKYLINEDINAESRHDGTTDSSNEPDLSVLLKPQMHARNVSTGIRKNNNTLGTDILCENGYSLNNIHLAINSITNEAWNKKTLGRLIICLSEYSKFESVNLNEISMIVYRPWDYSTVEIFAKKINRPFFLELPNFASQEEVEFLRSLSKIDNLSGYVVNNIYGLKLAAEAKLNVIVGLGMNVANVCTVNFIKNYCQVYNIDADFILSQELNATEIKSMGSGHFVFCEGEIYCMTLMHCPIKLNYNSECRDCKPHALFYKDEAGAEFRIKRRKVINCYFNLCNNVDLSIYEKLKEKGNYFFNMVDKNASDIQNVVEAYTRLNSSGEKTLYSVKSFTRGAYARLVK